ncbi:MAG: hypothetical protein HQ511_08290 [Rhodospirillales bacterium]|nr:hypothetical protein [Rhodospirillales bacterium]
MNVQTMNAVAESASGVPGPTLTVTRNVPGIAGERAGLADCPPSPLLGRLFLSPQDVEQAQARFDRQTPHSSWYGYSLIGTLPGQVVALVIFSPLGNRDALMIARLEDGIYAVSDNDGQVLATSGALSRLLDVFDEHSYRR